MKILTHKLLATMISLASLLLVICTTGCNITPQTLSGIESELTQLRANRALTDQTVRDLRAQVVQARSIDDYEVAYGDLRDRYNGLIDAIASAAESNKTKIDPELYSQVDDAARTFFLTSTRALGGSAEITRGIQESSVLNVPKSLPKLLIALPKGERKTLIRKWKEELRLPQWSRVI